MKKSDQVLIHLLSDIVDALNECIGELRDQGFGFSEMEKARRIVKQQLVAVMSDEYLGKRAMKLSKARLVEICKSNGVWCDGTKAELVDELVAVGGHPIAFQITGLYFDDEEELATIWWR